jgi:16S rRNA (cytidine1402-2'-O)-methyltransferase
LESTSRKTEKARNARPEFSATSEADKRAEDRLASGLYVTATPIGNARDITLRALDVLKGCDLIAAEDTRVTAKLLAIHGISAPLFSYNDANGAQARPKLLARLQDGARIALVSDAGTPLISDPGYKLVQAVQAEAIPVHVIPGPSAVLAGLILSGLPTDRFLFAGFLPAKSGERRTALAAYRDNPATLVFFESAKRLAETLSDMHDVLGARIAAVTRELTKLHEETRRADLRALAEHYSTEGPPRGEVTLVVHGADKLERMPENLDGLLRQALQFMPLRAATDLLAEALSLPRRELYARALMLKGSADDEP